MHLNREKKGFSVKVRFKFFPALEIRVMIRARNGEEGTNFMESSEKLRFIFAMNVEKKWDFLFLIYFVHTFDKQDEVMRGDFLEIILNFSPHSAKNLEGTSDKP